MKKKHSLFGFLILVLSVFSCTNTKVEEEIDVDKFLFEILDDSITGLTFNNSITENSVMNGFNYEYLYNGSGVSVGDLNNDGLVDLYFAANMVNNQLYLNKGDLKFEDVTQVSGTKGEYGFHQGTTMLDINADGKLDIYISKSGVFNDLDKRRNELYINKGNDSSGIPIFKEEAKVYGLDLPHYSTQASFFDYDKDGDLDMFLLNHNVNAVYVQENMEKLRYEKSEMSSDRLFRNDNGYYVDVSDEAGIINDAIGFGLGSAIGDLNNDSWPDIIVGQDYTAKDRMYLNQKNGTFKEIIKEATGHTSTFSMGNDIADFNNDGWLDFMSVDMVSEDNYGIKASMSGMNPEQFNFLVEQGFHYQYMYNALQMNNGLVAKTNKPVFSDIASLAGVSNTDWSWGPLFFDMDNDGDKDLFISNGIKRDFRNVDYVRYKNKEQDKLQVMLITTKESNRNTLISSFINDMLKMMPARKKNNYFFENNGDLSFLKKNKIWADNKLTATNGAAYADLDNDGDLDIVTNNMDDTAFIYKNNSAELGLGNYLKVKLKGSKNNPDGIGARVTIKTGEKKQVLEQYVSRGFQSSKDRVLHFGLGVAISIEELEVLWPDGKTEIVNNIKPNNSITLDYTAAKEGGRITQKTDFTFENAEDNLGLKHFSTENIFNDFERESLLPHKMSEEGPAVSVADVNNDGLDDIYIGGAIGSSGTLYIQNDTGNFQVSKEQKFAREKRYEDVSASFFDADSDGDLDLYVVSGGNEYESGSMYYNDRIYLNNNGVFERVNHSFKSQKSVSGSIVKPYDFDQDGDLDLFVGGRQAPGKYPYSGTSQLLRNDSKNGQIQFTNIEEEFLNDLGMVTDAIWADIDNDGSKDLIIVGEWMPVKIIKNESGFFYDFTKSESLNKETGWWFSLNAGDYDNDGDIDFVAGNLGLNSKYKTSAEAPFEVFAKDFDNTGSLDIVLGYYQEGKLFPLRGRQCSSKQMPFIKTKFPSYNEFASAELVAVYGEENVNTALHYTAANFATSYFENNGEGNFTIKKLPIQAQTTAITSIISEDINQDGNLDLLLFGNIYGFEVETPRQDAGYGLYLEGNGKGDFNPVMSNDSGLYVKGDVANVATIRLSGGQKAIGVAKKNDDFQMVKISQNKK